MDREQGSRFDMAGQEQAAIMHQLSKELIGVGD